MATNNQIIINPQVRLKHRFMLFYKSMNKGIFANKQGIKIIQFIK